MIVQGELQGQDPAAADTRQPSHLGPAATVGGVRLELSALQSLAAII